MVPKTKTAAGKRETLSPTVVGHRAEGVVEVTPKEGTILLSPVNSAATYHVPILLFGHECSFLVDTGTAVTLLSSTVWEKSRGAVPMALTPSQCRLVGATGELLTSHGSTKLPLTIGKTDFISPVTVINGLAKEGIIGLDFLQAHHCTIDFKTQTLSFPKEGFTLSLQSTVAVLSAATINAVLERSITIPPHSEIEVLVNAKGLQQKSGV